MLDFAVDQVGKIDTAAGRANMTPETMLMTAALVAHCGAEQTLNRMLEDMFGMAI